MRSSTINRSALLAAAALSLSAGTGSAQATTPTTPPPRRQVLTDPTRNVLLQMEIAQHNAEVDRKKYEKKQAKKLRRLGY